MSLSRARQMQSQTQSVFNMMKKDSVWDCIVVNERRCFAWSYRVNESISLDPIITRTFVAGSLARSLCKLITKWAIVVFLSISHLISFVNLRSVCQIRKFSFFTSHFLCFSRSSFVHTVSIRRCSVQQQTQRTSKTKLYILTAKWQIEHSETDQSSNTAPNGMHNISEIVELLSKCFRK